MEIERKWLVDRSRIPYDLETLPSLELEQVYISFSPSVRVRRMRAKDGTQTFVLTVKSAAKDTSELAREEFEIPIDSAAYAALRAKGEGTPIEKTRFFVHRADGLVEEIDLFHGALEGLAYLEIEFESVERAEVFPSPAWTTRDVTADKRFRNSALARFGRPEGV